MEYTRKSSPPTPVTFRQASTILEQELKEFVFAYRRGKRPSEDCFNRLEWAREILEAGK